ncbi:hypothetical protein [Phytohabitans kaempferiae]|uniref:Uncharacterized protein n=1 Tax=Phytohabitans kaempferiae TaxID=1620943 RepID=A0ABV6LUY5_9ACTN
MRLWDAFSNAMRTSRRRRIGPEDAERLLATGHDPARPELSRLLRAATAPPRRHELDGLEAALAAFEGAGRTTPPVAARQRWRALRPLAAAAATAAVLVGGVAVAAETGYLPGDNRPPPHEQLSPREVPPSPTHTSRGHASGPTHSTTPPSPSAQGSIPIDKRVEKLCRTWDDRRRKNKPMKPEELHDLSRVAGGEERIPTFCAPLIRPRGGGPASRPPSSTARPSATVSPSPTLSSGEGDFDQGDEDGDSQGNSRQEQERQRRQRQWPGQIGRATAQVGR